MEWFENCMKGKHNVVSVLTGKLNKFKIDDLKNCKILGIISDDSIEYSIKFVGKKLMMVAQY